MGNEINTKNCIKNELSDCPQRLFKNYKTFIW